MPNAKWNRYTPKSGDRKTNMAAANEIFENQAKGHPYSNQVMEAARKIRQYVASPSDIAMVSNALGGRQLANVTQGTMKKALGGSRFEKIETGAKQGQFKPGQDKDGWQILQAYNKQKWIAQKAGRAAGQPAGATPNNNAMRDQQIAQVTQAAQGNGASQSATSAPTPKYAAPTTAGDGPLVQSAQPATSNANVGQRLANDEKKIQQLAAKIIETDRKFKTVSKFVADAARRVGTAGELPTDAGLVNTFSEIQQRSSRRRPGKPATSTGTGSSFADTMERVDGYGRLAGKYAYHLKKMMSGDAIDSIGGGADFLKGASRDVSKLSKSKIGKTIANAIGDKLGAESGAGAKVLGSIAGGLESANEFVQVAKIAAKIGHSLIRTAEGDSGDAMRLGGAQLRIDEAMRGHMDPLQIRLDKMNVEHDRIARQGEGIAYVGDAVAFLRNRDGDYKREQLQRYVDARAADAPGLNTGRLSELSRERYFEEKYGKIQGRQAMLLDNAKIAIMGHDPEEEAEITKRNKASMGMAERLKAMMYDRMERGEFAAAYKLANEANKEVGPDQNFVWCDPMRQFIAMDNARGASRVFPLTQSMRRSRSYE